MWNIRWRSGSRDGCIGILGGYLSIDWDEIKSNGTSKVFFESIVGCSTSHECGWLGHVELCLVLCLLAID